MTRLFLVFSLLILQPVNVSAEDIGRFVLIEGLFSSSNNNPQHVFYRGDRHTGDIKVCFYSIDSNSRSCRPFSEHVPVVIDQGKPLFNFETPSEQRNSQIIIRVHIETGQVIMCHRGSRNRCGNFEMRDQ